MEKVYYCKGWSRHWKEPIELWSEEQARKAYEARTPYTALLGSVKRPRCFVESGGDVSVVGFLDQYLRNWVTHVFKEVQPSTMFLEQISHQSYVGDTDKIKEGVVLFFDQDGTSKAIRTFYDPPPRTRQKGSGRADVNTHYSPRPAFGEYEELTRMDRDQPVQTRTA